MRGREGEREQQGADLEGQGHSQPWPWPSQGHSQAPEELETEHTAQSHRSLSLGVPFPGRGRATRSQRGQQGGSAGGVGVAVVSQSRVVRAHLHEAPLPLADGLKQAAVVGLYQDAVILLWVAWGARVGLSTARQTSSMAVAAAKPRPSAPAPPAPHILHPTWYSAPQISSTLSVASPSRTARTSISAPRG